MIKLTPRESEILTLALSDLSAKQIARLVDVMPGTVKVHLYNIYRKHGVNNRIQLMLAVNKG